MSVPPNEMQFLCQSVLWIAGASARDSFRRNQTNSLAERFPPGRQREPNQRNFRAPSSARKSSGLRVPRGEVTAFSPPLRSTAIRFFRQKKRRSGPSLKLRFCNYLISWLCRPLFLRSHLIYCSPWARLRGIYIRFIKKDLSSSAHKEIVHKLDSSAILKQKSQFMDSSSGEGERLSNALR